VLPSSASLNWSKSEKSDVDVGEPAICTSQRRVTDKGLAANLRSGRCLRHRSQSVGISISRQVEESTAEEACFWFRAGCEKGGESCCFKAQGNAHMVPAYKRVKKYRSEGGAADLARVEVLVPPSARKEILAIASRLRAEYRDNKELRSLYENALQSYGTRILDNVDLDRLPDLRSRAAVAARAMIERGDARAFAMGRQMLDRVEAMTG
jgi:hypothetical protein